MDWGTVIGVETHAQIPNAVYQYQTVTDRHQSLTDA